MIGAKAIRATAALVANGTHAGGSILGKLHGQRDRQKNRRVWSALDEQAPGEVDIELRKRARSVAPLAAVAAAVVRCLCCRIKSAISNEYGLTHLLSGR